MTDVTDITPQLDKLESQLDTLEDALQPLLGNLEEMASRLPLLEKAKLFSLTAYAIESLLFSSLRLQGADAQKHAVYTELKRIQQYFGKIKAAEEEPETQRKLTVDKEATARILKANLGSDKALSEKLAEKIAEERAKALLREVENETRKRSAEDAPSASSGSRNGAQQQQQQLRKTGGGGGGGGGSSNSKKPKNKSKGKGKR